MRSNVLLLGLFSIIACGGGGGGHTISGHIVTPALSSPGSASLPGAAVTLFKETVRGDGSTLFGLAHTIAGAEGDHVVRSLEPDCLTSFLRRSVRDQRERLVV